MPMIDLADAVRADFLALSVPVTVYYGPDFKAQDDAGFRVVFIPTNDDYSFEHLPTNQNPRPIRTREQHATLNIWAKGADTGDPATQDAADWRALDALINQVIQSIEHVATGNYVIGTGRTNTTTPISGFGKQYDLDVLLYVPITEIPWSLASPTPDITTTLVLPAVET